MTRLSRLGLMGLLTVLYVGIMMTVQVVFVQDHGDPGDLHKVFMDRFTQSHSSSRKTFPNRKPSLKDPSSIPVFYNLYVGQTNDTLRVRNIVSEQMALLRPEHKPFYIQSMGVVQLDIPKAEFLGHRPNGTEMITLHSLWEFCRNHPSIEKVVYLHSKGSSRNVEANENLRKFLTVGALSEECATVDARTCNVCSSRFSPVPHPHTSGNMWLTRCDYVRQLIDPLEFEERMNAFTSNCTDKGRASCDGRLRFSAEHWIHSHPTVKPCDLYKDPGFVWDYAGVPENGAFEIELAKAPRFDIIKYVNWGKCMNRGTRLDHRLDEYWGLYQQRPDKSWWGWDFLQTDDSWMPENHKGASKWKKKKVCWNAKGTAPNQSRTEEKVDGMKASMNSCPSGSRIEQGPSLEQRKNTLISSPTETDIYTNKIKGTKKRVLVIAAVPRNKRHVLALWTQLECFTSGIDHIVLATPAWSKEITTQIVELAKSHIPRLGNGLVSIQAQYYLNNRYDVGLWCDAIGSLNAYDEFGLTNDSVFALRQFSEVFDALSVKNVSLTSVSYSYSPKFYKGNDGPQHFWLESVFRGFTRDGIDTFKSHSCVPEEHPFFCPGEDNAKTCIVNNFEHDLANQYPCEKVYGIYPSDAPPHFLEKTHHRTWARNIPYWRALWKDASYPIAKVKASVVKKYPSDKLEQCTKFYNQQLIEAIDYSLAVPRHKRRWENIDSEMQKSARRMLGLDSAMWKDWGASKFSLTPFHELTAEQQIFLESSLDCSEIAWNANSCGPGKKFLKVDFV